MWGQHYEPVLAYAMRRTGPEEAREVAAEAFLVAWRRLHHVPADELPWLLGVARKVLANRRRGADRADALAMRIAAQASTAAADPADRYDGAPLIAALNALREADREALLLVSWEGLTPAEAAVAAGCTAATFRVRLHRARRRLAQALADGGAEGPRATPAGDEA